MTIKQVITKYQKIEIEILLSEVLKKPREFLYLNPENSLSAGQLINLSALVKHRLKGEPMAYILGYKDFMGLRFKVNRHTLIPRPETEEMVERVVSGQWLVDRKKKLKILDVGTGSGCIIISLAKLIKPKSYNLKPEFYASDISSQALKVAKQNAKAHKAPVKFVLSDLLKNVKGNFDIIVANLPYVPNADFRMLNSDLKYEPKNAIFAKENGLAIIRRLLEQIAELKHQPVLIFLEFDPRQKVALSKLIKKTLPLYKAEFFKDLGGLWRYVEISLKL
jgi:release factor glutamine methyltransferase